MQRSINESGMELPLSVQYLDSAFASRLEALGMTYKSGIRQYYAPSDSTVVEAGYASAKYQDISSRFIPLKEDSILCIQGVVKNPYRYVISSVWYLFLPLWVMFLVVLDCILGQVKVLRTQRHLEQFQKDFTYAMIHDMKSPLSSILMGAHILNSGKLSGKPGKEEKYRQAMMEECEHLLTLSIYTRTTTPGKSGYNTFRSQNTDCSYCCKISRDADIFVDDATSSEVMVEQLRKKVKKRKIGAVCRFVYDRKMPADYLEFLVDAFGINRDDLVPGDKHLNLEDLAHLPNPSKELCTQLKPRPMTLNCLDEKESIFRYVSKKDLMLHFPYHSFEHFIHFLYEAVHNPS